MLRSKLHFQHIITRALVQEGDICVEDIQDALALPRDAISTRRVRDALRQAIKRLRDQGWDIRTIPRMDGGGYEFRSKP